MIIFINTPNRKNDADEITTNVGYLKAKLRDHRICSIANLGGNTDSEQQLYIVGHGYPDHIGPYSPQDLAHTLARYIEQSYLAKNVEIKEIIFASCNTGKLWHNTSFIDSFAQQLELELTTPTVISITGPNGMIAFSPSGEAVVLKDTNPYEIDTELSANIAEIDSANPDAMAQIAKYLEENPYRSVIAVPSQFLLSLNLQLVVVTPGEEPNLIENEHYVSQTNDKIFVSNKTYNHLTHFFSTHKLSEPFFDPDQPQKNQSFYFKPKA